MSLTELADVTGIPKSSCHAIVSTLTDRGYLYSLARPRALYPTRRLFDLAKAVVDNDPFAQRAATALERLRQASGETVILGKRQGDAVIYLQVIEGPQAIRYSACSGEFKPLMSSAAGKAVLGSMKEAELRSYLAARSLPAITSSTLVDRDALLTDIAESRKRGYFVSRGENVPDVWAVSAFVNLRTEAMAVAIAGPAVRVAPRLSELATLLVATCSLLARQTG